MTRTLRVISVWVILNACASAQQAVSPPAPVAGVVSDAQTGTPIRRARVERAQAQVGPASTRSSPVFTDENGRFLLDLRGDAVLTVTKAGYALETLNVAAPSRTGSADVRVVMKRGAAI